MGFLIGFVIILYIIPAVFTARDIYLTDGWDCFMFISLIPMLNIITSTWYIDDKLLDDLKLLRSKFASKPTKILSVSDDGVIVNYTGKTSPTRSEIDEFKANQQPEKKVKRLVKRVEPVPATMKIEVETKVVTYRLANDTEVVEKHEITPKPKSFVFTMLKEIDFYVAIISIFSDQTSE